MRGNSVGSDLITIGAVLVSASVAMSCGVGDSTPEEGVRDAFGEAQYGVTARDDHSAQRLRQSEVDDHIRKLIGGRRVVHSLELSNGDMVDWLEPESGSSAKSVPPPPDVVKGPDVGAHPLKSVLDDYDRPRDAIPFVHPRFSPYVDGSSGKSSLAEYLREIPHGTPIPGAERLWAGAAVNAANVGLAAFVNAAWTSIDVPASDNFSIYQMNAFDNGDLYNAAEWAGIAVGRLPQLVDNNYRMYFEFITGLGIGDYQGGWAPGVRGYETVPGTAFPPGVQMSQYSVVNGAQYEGMFVIERHALCPISASCTGAWWVWIRDQWVGYFPIGSSSPMINFDRINVTAAGASFYGEVYDESESSWTSADMGSGLRPATSGLSNGYSAYARDMQYLSTSGWVRPSTFGYVAGEDSACYRAYIYNSASSPWYRTLFFGGDGGDASGCDPY